MFVLTALKNILSRFLSCLGTLSVEFWVLCSWSGDLNGHTYRECQTTTCQTWGFFWSAKFFSKFPLYQHPSFWATSYLDAFGGFWVFVYLSHFFFFTYTSISKYHVTQTLCNHNHIFIIWAPCGWLLRLSLRLSMFLCAALFWDPLMNVWCPYYCTVGPVCHHCSSFITSHPSKLKKGIHKVIVGPKIKHYATIYSPSSHSNFCSSVKCKKKNTLNNVLVTLFYAIAMNMDYMIIICL